MSSKPSLSESCFNGFVPIWRSISSGMPSPSESTTPIPGGVFTGSEPQETTPEPPRASAKASPDNRLFPTKHSTIFPFPLCNLNVVNTIKSFRLQFLFGEQGKILYNFD